MQKSITSMSARFCVLSGKGASASRAMSPNGPGSTRGCRKPACEWHMGKLQQGRDESFPDGGDEPNHEPWSYRAGSA